MRDIVLTAFIFGTLPFILWRPHIGVLVWTWIGFMNPHRLTWSFAYDMPFAMIVALATLVSLLSSREPKKIPWTRETILLMIFLLWTVLTTVYSMYPAFAWQHLNQFWKILLMVYVTMMLMQSRERINQLVWVIALSIGFYGVKGGIFTIVHGGVYHVRGPEGSFIGGDNEMGLALIMTIPLLRYLQLTTSKTWVRSGLAVAMVLCAVATVGSQSRGALLGLVAMGSYLWLKSRNKIFTALLGGIAIGLVLAVMPQQWYDRMETIKHYDTDQSALGRINAWKMAFNMAKDRPLGGGFDSFHDYTFELYAPDPGDVHDSHSIYFEVLGEHGFVGLGLFLMLALMTWRTAAWVISRAHRDRERRWVADLAAMIQVSLVGYASAGAFLGLAYFDYYYTLVALVVLCRTALVSGAVANVAVPAAPAAKPPLVGRPATRPGWAAFKPTGPAGGLGKRQ
ncbi:MAG: putative O-glycosylation ligase, exosortase A system-associated [Betaproteobacteria bacterium]|nr:MAG: putative O-glycosylation ligase, exosortase A system-associated [Betaproteobacteria bacterium]